MANYVTLSMPRAELKALLMLAQVGFTSMNCPITHIEIRALTRLRLAIAGKDLRATNRHNTHATKAAP